VTRAYGVLMFFVNNNITDVYKKYMYTYNDSKFPLFRIFKNAKNSDSTHL